MKTVRVRMILMSLIIIRIKINPPINPLVVSDDESDEENTSLRLELGFSALPRLSPYFTRTQNDGCVLSDVNEIILLLHQLRLVLLILVMDRRR